LRENIWNRSKLKKCAVKNIILRYKILESIQIKLWNCWSLEILSILVVVMTYVFSI
jgi:hypothetical protein